MGSEIKERLKVMLSEIKGDKTLVEKITDSIDLINSVGLDSIQMVNFILLVEDEFGIEINFENFGLANLKNIEIFGQYIMDLKAKAEVSNLNV
jgi:acyl carrier protein